MGKQLVQGSFRIDVYQDVLGCNQLIKPKPNRPVLLGAAGVRLLAVVADSIHRLGH
jgi:hypothetical protein